MRNFGIEATKVQTNDVLVGATVCAHLGHTKECTGSDCLTRAIAVAVRSKQQGDERKKVFMALNSC